MAILEPRLLPLIETLAEAGADWLAFEVVDGIRAGRVPEEHLETLEGIQDAVRSAKLENFRGDKRESSEPSPVPQAVPITGDDQIRWATAYVYKRLADSLFMLQTSVERLESIVRTTSVTHDGGLPEGQANNEITLVVQADEQKRSVRGAEVANAIAALQVLQNALSSWEASTRARSGNE